MAVRPFAPLTARTARSALAIVALVALLGFSAQSAQAQATSNATAEEPTGIFLNPEEITALATAFNDQPLTGGQVPPRISRFITPDVFMFLQFDSPDPAQATELRYVGIGVKSVFCAETQPDRSFTHFHRYEADEYKNGHGGDPGAQGYWLTWVAVNSFEARDGRKITPGVDYEFSPTPPPTCGANVPTPDFTPAGADALTPEETQQLMGLFNDSFLTGGQAQPRAGKWVNENVFIFLQGDMAPAEATSVRYLGIGVKGVFCAETQPSTDFPHYHRVHAAEYREGHAGPPGEQNGYWLLWVATQSFETRDGRQVNPGVDREFSPTPPPTCGAETPATPVTQSVQPTALAVRATEWRFVPSTLTVRTDQDTEIDVTNGGTQLHTFTIPELHVDTGPLQPGETEDLRFTAPAKPGSYDFICTFPGHEEAGMIGTLAVE
jgi:plastocyanin